MLGACTAHGGAPENYQTRPLPSGKAISVVSMAPDKDKSLVLTYVSPNELKDREAVIRESAEIWVPFKEEVERGGYNSAVIVATTPSPGNEMTRRISFELSKNPDGSWICVKAPAVTTDELLYSKTKNDLQNGKFDAALENLNKLIVNWPNSSVALALRAVCYLALEQPSNAIKDLDRAVALDPSNAQLYSNRGSAYAELGDNSRALSDLNHAILLDPKSDMAMVNRGEVLLQANKPKEAIVDFTKAIALNAKLGEAYFYRAEANEKIGDIAQAKKDLETAAALKYSPTGSTVEER